MKAKRLISALLSGVMLMTSGGIIPAMAEETPPQESAQAEIGGIDLLTADNLKVDLLADLTPSSSWEFTADNSVETTGSHFMVVNASSAVTMGDGYGADSDWFGIEFIPSIWTDSGDTCLYDTEGTPIIAYHNDATPSITFGQGEASFGASDDTHKDSAENIRFSNYLKSEVTAASDAENIGKFSGFNRTTDLCQIVVENRSGKITDDYMGDYYTVKIYKNKTLISTEYYSGKANGIKKIETSAGTTTYYGAMKIYSGNYPDYIIRKTEITADKTAQWRNQETDTRQEIAVHGWETWEDAAYMGFTLPDDFDADKVKSAKVVVNTISATAPNKGLPSAFIYSATYSAFDNNGNYKTAENAPEYNTTEITAFNAPSAAGDLEIDVTSYVKTLSGNNAAFRIDVKSQNSNNAWQMGSCNNGGVAPKLVLTYNSMEKTPEISVDSYTDETLTGFEDKAEYTIDGNDVTISNGTLSATDYIGKTINIVKKSRDVDKFDDSAAQSLNVPARPNAPTGLESTAVQTENGSDGTITGVDDTMEYKAENADKWSAVDENATTVTGLAAGTYNVRYKATDNAFASESATVIVGGYVKPTETATPTTEPTATPTTEPTATPTTEPTATPTTKPDNPDPSPSTKPDEPSKPNTVDLIKDGNFESVSFTALDWLFKTYDIWYSNGEIKTDGDNKYASITDTGLGQNIAVEPNVTYTLTAKVKSTGTVNLAIQNGDAAWPGSQPAETLDTVEITGADWHTVTAKFTTDDSSPSHLFIYIWSPAGITTDIDDISFTKVVSDNPLENMDFPYTAEGYKIAGNITLPKETDGCAITWTSSNKNVISSATATITGKGDNYTEYPAGKVTRPNTDTEVTLKAELTKNGTKYDKEFKVTVKAAPAKSYDEMDNDGDFKGYLYTSFIEPPLTTAGQQTYFALSDDGLNWRELNGDKPVLESSMGTKGLRDHYLIRSPEGDRFYLIATDLDCTAYNGNWTHHGEQGSKYIMVWESDDLVNWSKQRMVKLADLTDETNSGCAWAPEAIYDDITGEYVMYWSATDMDDSSATKGKKVVYYSKTRDFYSFTPQKKFVEPISTDGNVWGTSDSFIDTTMIEGSDGKFYRVTKFEGMPSAWNCGTKVFMDVADAPLGTFTRVKTNLADDAFDGVEGPGWFKFNKDDAERTGNKYCLMLDGYNGSNAGVGFFPNTVADLNWTDENTEINFTKVTDGFRMRTSAKHGGILPITQAEYNALALCYDDFESIDFGVEDLKTVKSNLTLPTASADDTYTISWESSNKSVVENNGTVHRPASGKHKVTLTATLDFKNGITKEIPVEVIVCGDVYNDFTLTVKNEKGVDIQPNMYGLFFEDINFAADGGLYAEMVENRSFEELMHERRDTGTNGTWSDPGYAWSTVDGTMKYDKTTDPLNETNTHYLSFTGKSFKNQAYEGMYVEKDKKYNISFYARVGSYTGGITAKTVKDNTTGFSARLTADNIVDSEYSKNGWAKYTAQVTADNTVRKSDFIIELDNSATVDFDVISVMPDDAVCGVFRKDLAEKLKDLNPGFLRFPGGCIIEGWDLDNAYNWKDSVGPIEERKQNWNRWATSLNPTSYNQTYGLGYYEYFILCEYLDCDPVPVQNVGMACEYQGGKRGGNNVPVFESDGRTYTDEFYKYIQDTLDLIEFANSTDFENSEWARLRRNMGHPQPFNLETIGIGNEQWEISGSEGYNNWYARYEAFEKEIHKRYPDIKLIGTSGPSKDGKDFDNAWSWVRRNQAQNDKFTYAVDEHYYVATSWFYENDNRYDEYDRSAKVFAGEYAAWTDIAADGTIGARNNLDSALAEASFMTGLERNADVVYMASYAPLFARLNYVQWNPDMIWFDDTSSFATPDYWVQHMYMNNNGSYTLKSEVTDNLDKVYQTVSFDEKSGDVIIKIANPTDEQKQIQINLDNKLGITGTATVETLKGDNLADCNSISEPDKIKPITESVTGVTAEYTHTIPALSFQVIRVKTTNAKVEKAISIDKVSTSSTSINYTLKAGADFDEDAYDIYTAVYDKNGVLMGVTKNNMTGSAPVKTSGQHTVKLMVWEKDTMKPSDIAPETKTVTVVASDSTASTEKVAVAKSTLGNPIAGFDENGNIAYGGDVAPLVVKEADGTETMYIYTGHDTAPVTQDKYVIPEWICYSSKDLVNWEYHGVIMDAKKSTIPWAANDGLDAWASQVVEQNGKYYFYFCTFGSKEVSNGYSCIGVAVSDSPTGPFVPYVADGETENKPLVNGNKLGLPSSVAPTGAMHYDIDPTAWIEKDASGVEHIYLNWGNTYNITCELNADMVTVKDINGDGQITTDDFKVNRVMEGSKDLASKPQGQHDYREAPWIYRRKDANGNYTGQYYLFFADGWRESYSYATTDDLMSGEWTFRGSLMSPNATADTSHGGVVDFGGKTYYVYHNGALTKGSGYRRVANIQELTFNADGTITEMEELSTGVSGWATTIKTADGKFVGHESFYNPRSMYPLYKSMTIETEEKGNDTKWELEKGKADPSNPSYVSIQSVNKPGLYITANKADGVFLTQDHNKFNDAAAQMTFITRKALNGKADMVSFESVSAPDHYLTAQNGKLVLSYGIDKDSASFSFGNEDKAQITEIMEVKKSYTDLFGASAAGDGENIVADSALDNTITETPWNFPNEGIWYAAGTFANATDINGHDKAASVADAGKGGGVYQRITLEKGKAYKFSMDVNFAGKPEGAGIGIYLANGNTTGGFAYGYNNMSAVGTISGANFDKFNEWQTITGTFTPETSGVYYIGVWGGDKATTYFDNVSLLPSGTYDTVIGSYTTTDGIGVKIATDETAKTPKTLTWSELITNANPITVKLTITDIPANYTVIGTIAK